MEFLDLKTIYLILHIFGAIIGAGAAFAGDAIFFSTIKDGRIDKHEFRFMKLAGNLVWLGLFILGVSGVLLFSTNVEGYLASSKFLAKMAIVAVIVINGAIFHLAHFPRIRGHLGLKFADHPSFMKKAPLLLISGAISVVSWVSTVILGTLKHVPYSFSEIIGFYLTILIIVAITILAFQNFILKSR